MKVDIAREIALKILYKINEEDGYSNLVLNEYLNKYRGQLTKKDINFISEIIYGTTSMKLTIDNIIQKYSNVKLKKLSKWVLNILRMGTYQILFLDKVPKSAAVNESVNLCKKYAFKSTGLVNAILRKIGKEDYDELLKIENLTRKLSLYYSMPEWIVEELLKEYSIQDVEKILKNSNVKPKTTIRINTLKISKQEFTKKLGEYKIEYEDTNIENFLYIKNMQNIAEADLFKEGFFTVQDIGAGKISIILNPQENEKVLDLCSAPGGKTTHIAELMQNTGSIIAQDIYEKRLNLVKDNYIRLGITNIKTQTTDASILNDKFINQFDKILADVPCLGIGVIKRKPDIKWQKEENGICEITKIQGKILENALKYLKINGEVVYSTCSILKCENEDIIEKCLKNNKNFKIVHMEKILPSENTDGFFICKIKRIS